MAELLRHIIATGYIYKTETDAEQVMELKQMSAVFFHIDDVILVTWRARWWRHITTLNSNLFVFTESIVNLLIENGADCMVENRRRQTPFMVTHNIRVARLLSDAAKRYKVSHPD